MSTKTAECFQKDDVTKLMETYDWADKIVSVSPSYWADIRSVQGVYMY